jgi:hypothetical protein
VEARWCSVVPDMRKSSTVKVRRALVLMNRSVRRLLFNLEVTNGRIFYTNNVT